MRRHITDPDADLDITRRAEEILQGPPEPLSGPSPASATQRPRRVRHSAAQRPAPGPDTLPGLARYFCDQCPPVSWAGGMEIGNIRALIGVLSELRRTGLTPAEVRTVIDLYFVRLGERRPSRPYVWDFKWQRFGLVGHLRDNGAFTTSSDYLTWNQAPADDSDARAAFAATWESGA